MAHPEMPGNDGVARGTMRPMPVPPRLEIVVTSNAACDAPRASSPKPPAPPPRAPTLTAVDGARSI